MEDVVTGLSRVEPHHKIFRRIGADSEFRGVEVVEGHELRTDVVGRHMGTVPTDDSDEGEGECLLS
jgi:hypothetical protein